jgi:hypothetical protein
MVVIDYEGKEEIQRHEIFLDKLSLYERQRILTSLKVDVLVCGGITEIFQKMIDTPDNQIITGRTGDVEEVFVAFLSGKINSKKFLMPGYKTKE